MLALMACHDSTVGTPVFHAQEKPPRLSDWNVLRVDGNTLMLADRVVSYDLNTPLFSDYAHKLRTVWMPEGSSAKYRETESFEFPVGTIISKTFYYPTGGSQSSASNRVMKTSNSSTNKLFSGINLHQVKLIETRLLVHRKEGWLALPYVWNEDESEAILKRVGDVRKLVLSSDQTDTEFAYVVPNENECAGCHATNATTRELRPIGPRARHLDKQYVYSSGQKNQISAWVEQGILSGLPNNIEVKANALWGDLSQDLDHRARSYLDINCSHCHNVVGSADTSGLLLEPTTEHGVKLGLCKLPIAAGNGTGNRKYGIVPGKPEESILSYRMKSTLPSEMMPELGRSLRHDEGVALINTWILNMGGSCGTQAL
jgi:uncharacterized repeat protein (TIGR03806 family)